MEASSQPPIEIPPKSTKKMLMLSVVFFLALSMMLGTGAYLILEQKKGERERSLAALASSTPQTVGNPESFSTVSVEAHAAYVVDLSTNAVLYQKNASAQLPLASITKLMTALLARQLIPLTTPVSISERALMADGDSGLALGQHWNRDSLINLTLVESSNDGASALALAGAGESGKNFLDEMNMQGKKLGMRETFYVNPTGLDLTGTQGGSYGSARDTALLMSHIIQNYPDLVQATRFPLYSARSLEGAYLLVHNTNQDVIRIPGIIGSKTGFTDLAHGNLVVAFDRGLAQPVVVVVLGSSQTGRFRDVETLITQTFSYYHQPIATP